MIQAKGLPDEEVKATAALTGRGRGLHRCPLQTRALFRTGRVDEGIAELERGAALSPGEALWLAQLGQAYGLAGRREQALEIVRRLESWPTAVSPYHMAYAHIGLGDFERALDFLEQAFVTGSGATIGLKGSFLFAPLRGHPRFTALLKRMRLA